MSRITEKTGSSEVQTDSSSDLSKTKGRDLTAEKQRFADLMHGKRGPAGKTKQQSNDSQDDVVDEDSPLQRFPSFSLTGNKPKVKTAQPQQSNSGQNQISEGEIADREAHLGTQAKVRQDVGEDATIQSAEEDPDLATNKRAKTTKTVPPQSMPASQNSVSVKTDPSPVTLPTQSIEDPEELLPQTEKKQFSVSPRRSAKGKTASVSASTGRKSTDQIVQQGSTALMSEINSANAQSQNQQEHGGGEHSQQTPPSELAQATNTHSDHVSDKDKTKKVDDLSAEASGDRILQGLMGTDPTPTQAQPTVDNVAPTSGDRISDIADKLAQRILVSGPSSTSDPEVRIHLRDSVLQGSEVTVRQEQGQLVVGFNVPNNDVQQQLQPHTDNLQQMLGDKLNQPIRVEVNVQSGGADSGGAGSGGAGSGGSSGGGGQRGGSDQSDGRSRNRRDWQDEWESGS